MAQPGQGRSKIASAARLVSAAGRGCCGALPARRPERHVRPAHPLPPVRRWRVSYTTDAAPNAAARARPPRPSLPPVPMMMMVTAFDAHTFQPAAGPPAWPSSGVGVGGAADSDADCRDAPAAATAATGPRRKVRVFPRRGCRTSTLETNVTSGRRGHTRPSFTSAVQKRVGARQTSRTHSLSGRLSTRIEAPSFALLDP
jgi:hypothetical protein